jgi:hypothetical protein
LVGGASSLLKIKNLTLGTDTGKPDYLVFDVRGFVHHSKMHEEKSKKMQQFIRLLLFPIYMKLNMFRATHRPSSGA